MQSLLICALFGFALAASPVFHSKIKPAIFEDEVNSTIEGLRPDIPDPIELDDLTLDFSNSTLIKGKADLSNFQLTGLKGFQVTNLNLDIFGFQLGFTLVLPTMNANTDYTGDLLLVDLLPLYGTGKANIHLVDTEITGSANLDLSNGLAISKLKVTLYLGESTFDIHGALDNEDFSSILSEVLNDVATSFVDNHQDVISNIISPPLQDVINGVLAGTDTNTTPAPAVD